MQPHPKPALVIPLPNRVPIVLKINTPSVLSQGGRVSHPSQKPRAFTPETIDEDTIVATAHTLTKEEYISLLRLLEDNYHNDQALLTDETYDELIDTYEAKYGKYISVGAEPRREKVVLPYYLGSLDKIKTDTEVDHWLTGHPGPFIVQDKVDGLTLLLVYNKGSLKIYTRGGGVNGMDVSHLSSYVKLPRLTMDIAVRVEIVLTKDAFARVGAGYKNARNLTSGVVNSKKQFKPEIAQELTCYAYRIITKNQTPEVDIMELMALGFNVPNPVLSPTLDREQLHNYLSMRKRDAPYEIDGLVVYQNIVGNYPVGGFPTHAIAFKAGTETAITTVTHVSWEASKDRLLKPVIHYHPVMLSGAELQKASGYNARFIFNHKIGPGARIMITRSGDVIPKVLGVVEPSTPDLPDVQVHGKYTWNANEVEFVLEEDNEEVTVNKLRHFITTLDIKNMGPERVKAFVHAGVRTIEDLLGITPGAMMAIPGFSDILSSQVYHELHEKVTNVPLPLIMAASGLFPGIGEKRFTMILDAIPNFIEYAYNEPAEIALLIRQVRGFDALADRIAADMGSFADWLKQHPAITILKVSPIVVLQHRPLEGMTIVFSGFRDKNLETSITNKGGRVTTSVSKNTTMLILRDLSPENMKGKAQEATSKGIPIIARDEFVQKYLA
jgi:DNA ligase (NAD+)